jgi:hypothetical protein
MTVMLCRNRVADFSKWKAVFDANLPSATDAGLRLTNLWQDLADPNNVFFLFEVESVERARAFIEDPEAAKSGEASGVLDGECHFLSAASV